MTNKTAIVFNANDPQIPQAHLFIESLRDPARGDYGGDIWIVSTGLSSEAKSYAEIMGLNYIEDSMDFLWEWPGWHPAAEYTFSQKPQVKPQLMPANTSSCLKYLAKRFFLFLWKQKQPAKEEILCADEEALKEYFCEFRNKRLSKLLFLNFLEQHGKDYEKIILCDTDILAQSPVKGVFDQLVDDRLYYWREDCPILPGTSLWRKNQAYKKLLRDRNRNVDLGGHEINIGFLAGMPQCLQKVLSMQKELELAEEHIELISHRWHEQDYFRLLRGLHPGWFTLFKEGTVVHLCNGGEKLIKEIKPLEFRYIISGTKPTIVHFTSASWAQFDSINKTYRMKPEDFFSYYVDSKP